MTNGTAAERLLADKRAERATVMARITTLNGQNALWARLSRLNREIDELEAATLAAKERTR